MIIEVGKSYIDINDNNVDIIYNDLINGLFIGLFRQKKNATRAVGFFNKDGLCVSSTWPPLSNLVKEYKEPFRDEFEKEIWINADKPDKSYSFNYVWGLDSAEAVAGWKRVKAKIVLEEIID